MYMGLGNSEDKGSLKTAKDLHMFMLVPTVRYPEYWLTPGVVSQMPELVTNSIFAPVAACSKTVKLTPSRSTKDRLSLMADSKGAADTRAAPMASPMLRRLDNIMVERESTPREQDVDV